MRRATVRKILFAHERKSRVLIVSHSAVGTQLTEMSGPLFVLEVVFSYTFGFGFGLHKTDTRQQREREKERLALRS